METALTPPLWDLNMHTSDLLDIISYGSGQGSCSSSHTGADGRPAVGLLPSYGPTVLVCWPASCHLLHDLEPSGDGTYGRVNKGYHWWRKALG